MALTIARRRRSGVRSCIAGLTMALLGGCGGTHLVPRFDGGADAGPDNPGETPSEAPAAFDAGVEMDVPAPSDATASSDDGGVTDISPDAGSSDVLASTDGDMSDAEIDAADAAGSDVMDAADATASDVPASSDGDDAAQTADAAVAVDTPTDAATPDLPPAGSYRGTTVFPVEVVMGTAIAADGSYFVVGDFRSPADFDPGPGMDLRTPRGVLDTFLTKLNPDGTYAWTITFGGPGALTASRAVAISASSIVVAGLYDATVDFDPGPGVVTRTPPASTFSTYVARFSLDAKLVWVGTFDGPSDCQPYAVNLPPGGGVYVAGLYHGPVDFDPGPGTEIRTTGFFVHGFVVKLSEDDGHMIWIRTSTGDNCEIQLQGLTVSADGNVWATGQGGGCNFGGATPIDVDGTTFVVSFTPNGDPRFMLMLGGQSNGMMASAAPDGSVYIGGFGFGPGDFDPGPGVVTRTLPGTNGSGFILKLAADGTFRWVHVLAESGVRAVAARQDNSVVALAPTSTDAIFPRYLITRIAADSTVAWSISAGGPGIGLTALAAGPSGFAFAGLTDMANDFDPGATVDVVPANIAFLTRFAD